MWGSSGTTDPDGRFCGFQQAAGHGERLHGVRDVCKVEQHVPGCDFGMKGGPPGMERRHADALDVRGTRLCQGRWAQDVEEARQGSCRLWMPGISALNIC